MTRFCSGWKENSRQSACLMGTYILVGRAIQSISKQLLLGSQLSQTHTAHQLGGTEPDLVSGSLISEALCFILTFYFCS